jgi:hypothetical protein
MILCCSAVSVTSTVRLISHRYQRHSPGFNPSILRHGGIFRVADEAVLNKVLTKKKQGKPEFLAH